MDIGLIEMTIPDKPCRSRQGYRLTRRRAEALAGLLLAPRDCSPRMASRSLG